MTHGSSPGQPRWRRGLRAFARALTRAMAADGASSGSIGQMAQLPNTSAALAR
jgi:hypothetical protein